MLGPGQLPRPAPISVYTGHSIRSGHPPSFARRALARCFYQSLTASPYRLTRVGPVRHIAPHAAPAAPTAGGTSLFFACVA